MSENVATGAGYRLMWMPTTPAWFALQRVDGSGVPRSFLETDLHSDITAEVVRTLEAAVALRTVNGDKWRLVVPALKRYLFGDTTATNGQMVFRTRTATTWTSAAATNEYQRSPPPDELERAVLNNRKPRRVLRTTDTIQQVAMSVWWLPAESHPNTDQYFLVKAGQGEVVVDGTRTALRPLSAFVVERGSGHEVRSTGDQPLQLLVLYTPRHHDAGRIDEVNVDFLDWMKQQ